MAQRRAHTINVTESRLGRVKKFVDNELHLDSQYRQMLGMRSAATNNLTIYPKQ